MAQDIIIAGTSFPAVPAIEVPKNGGGVATFADPSGTTAVAADVSQGKWFLTDQGVLTQGTASGGGGSSYTLLGSAEFTTSGTSTSSTKIGSITIGSSVWTSAKLIYVRVRDKAGKRNGYYWGTDIFFANTNPASGSTSDFASKLACTYRCENNVIQNTNSFYGVYANNVTADGVVNIYRRYNSTYTKTINGTYKVEVYSLEWPGNVSPFA